MSTRGAILESRVAAFEQAQALKAGDAMKRNCVTGPRLTCWSQCLETFRPIHTSKATVLAIGRVGHTETLRYGAQTRRYAAGEIDEATYERILEKLSRTASEEGSQLHE